MLQSCIDINMSKYMHYMKALDKVIWRLDMNIILECCSCEQHKKVETEQRAEDFVESSCCN